MPSLVALILAVLYVDPFIGDWDGLDYTVLSLHGEASTMALGRLLFIFFNHALWLVAHKIFHLQAEHAYLLFKYTVVAQSPLAVLACWTLARDLTASKQAATIAALLVAVSPIYVLYSGQVMTDVPSLLLVTTALIIHLRGLRSRRVWLVLLGAALLGAGVNLRETVAFYAPWLVIAPFVCGWKLRGREIALVLLSCLVFLALAFAPFIILYTMDVKGYQAAWHGWRESMREESARHPVELRNLLPFLFFFFVLSPVTFVALPFAAWQEWRKHRLSPLLLMALVGLFATLLLFFNYSTAINWRYFLTGLPALVPLVAAYILSEQQRRTGNERRAFRRIVAAIICLTIASGIYLAAVNRERNRTRNDTKNYRERLRPLPRDAVVIAGGQTIAVNYWRALGTGEWETIGTGGGWPGERLVPVLENYLQAGRRVFLDKDPHGWAVCGWPRNETLAIAALDTRFHFRRISETVYEIRPLADETAHDTPNLSELLPENRPADTKKCRAVDKES